MSTEMNFQTMIREMAHDYWNFDKMPPVNYWHLVLEYIQNHPEEFKGMMPQ